MSTELSGEDRRARNVATLEAYFTHLAALDVDSWIELWAEGCVQVMPFAAGGVPGRVEGRDLVRELYQGMANGYAELTFADLEILPLDDPDKVLALWRPRGRMTDGREYANENVGLFEFDADGRIAMFTEYFHPVRVAEAFAAEGALS
ncbi:nuclear transport factor 2 family protein [Saccharothrix sp. NRRL B-16348]|uniref:nuclear transport factor 2 family protein n=1 Tax=Saccharothrix sp. NRRL B-16348 TaxID=1415542 RepID=UPI0006AE72CA|nr:nuclear transport factor 2 family protein [Saccharothrix sp. NRRL B-16348]